MKSTTRPKATASSKGKAAAKAKPAAKGKATKAKPAAKAPANPEAAGSSDAGRVAELEQALAEAQQARHEAEAALAEANRRAEALTRRAGELEEKVSTQPSPDTPAAAGALVCPRCGGKMVEIEHRGVTIDWCSGCEGLYFDAGELEEVIRREYPESDEPEIEAVPVALPEDITGKVKAQPVDKSDRVVAPGSAAAEGAKSAEPEATSPPAPSPEPKRGFFKSLFSRKAKPAEPSAEN